MFWYFGLEKRTAKDIEVFLYTKNKSSKAKVEPEKALVPIIQHYNRVSVLHILYWHINDLSLGDQGAWDPEYLTAYPDEEKE